MKLHQPVLFFTVFLTSIFPSTTLAQKLPRFLMFREGSAFVTYPAEAKQAWKVFPTGRIVSSDRVTDPVSLYACDVIARDFDATFQVHGERANGKFAWCASTQGDTYVWMNLDSAHFGEFTNTRKRPLQTPTSNERTKIAKLYKQDDWNEVSVRVHDGAVVVSLNAEKVCEHEFVRDRAWRREGLLGFIADGELEIKDGVKVQCLSPPGIPTVGFSTVPNIALLDKVMINMLYQGRGGAISVAITDRGKLTVFRSYGWLDREREKPVPVDVLLPIASCDKAMCLAGFRSAMKAHPQVNGNTPLYQALGIKGNIRKPLDPRTGQILLKHLLVEKTGFAADPTRAAVAAGRRLGIERPTLDQRWELIMTGPLQHAPGEKSVHLNFNFHTMWRVTETLSGAKNAEEYLKKVIQAPAGIKDFHQYTMKPLNADQLKRTVWNYRSGGPTVATTASMVQFMTKYNLNGTKQGRVGNGMGFLFGSMPTSTAIMSELDMDRLNIAAVINTPTGKVTHAHLNDRIRGIYRVMTGRVKKIAPATLAKPWFGAANKTHWVQELRPERGR